MDSITPSLMLGLLILVTAAFSFFWLSALIDCLRSDFRSSGDKIAWLLVVILFPVLGSVLYWCFAKKVGRSHRQQGRHGRESHRRHRHAPQPTYAKIPE